MLYTIYTLTCPIDNTIRYVGVTRKELKHRLSCHMCDYYSNATKVNWLKALRDKGLKPTIEPIDVIDLRKNKRKKSLSLESYWIDQLRVWGFELYNTKKSVKC